MPHVWVGSDKIDDLFDRLNFLMGK